MRRGEKETASQPREKECLCHILLSPISSIPTSLLLLLPNLQTVLLKMMKDTLDNFVEELALQSNFVCFFKSVFPLPAIQIMNTKLS